MFCCDNIPAKYSPVESSNSRVPPGLRRNQNDPIVASPKKDLVKTGGNALREAPPSSPSMLQISDEYNAQTTLSAVVPPNVIPGMVFIVEVPSQHKWTGNTADDSEVSDLLLKEEPTKMQSTYVPVYETVPLEDKTTTNTTSSVKEIV
ncbi:predicted protein [Thalassiosira pseudonana CCMP1335]|uniref:Uncharacterized protein n=1 Tax=Thalassiosira pseudonana TaxID=35128 RepID=B8C214_THAPS|nr:predicted protein [Thalassiosira pseudonana CCMP1335]EED92314.1 predicted protein [Thalassiosira pseudonana CCMP1335]